MTTNHPNRSRKALGLYAIIHRTHGGDMGDVVASSAKQAVQFWIEENDGRHWLGKQSVNTLSAERRRDATQTEAQLAAALHS